MHDRYLKTDEAAELLGLSRRTLDRYRLTGDGPAFHKFGNSVRYRLGDIETWADARRKTSTSDDGGRDRGARRRPRGARRGSPRARPGPRSEGVRADRLAE